MRVVSPTQWGARVDYDAWHYSEGHIVRYFVHWPGSNIVSDAAAALRGIERYHIDSKGWLGIAYDWAIDKAGTLYRLRGSNRSAATSGDIDGDDIPENMQSDAVLFLVGLDGVTTGAQQNTFKQMFAVRPLPVWGHRDVFLRSGTGTNTTCPGDSIYSLIQDEFYLGDDMSQFLEDFEAFATNQGAASAWNLGADVWQNMVQMAAALGVQPGDQTGFKNAFTKILQRLEALEDASGGSVGVGEHTHTAATVVGEVI